MENLINKKILTEIITESLIEKIGTVVKEGRNNPLNEIVKNAIEEEEEMLNKLLKEILSEIILDNEFKEILKKEFKHKVAKSIVGGMQGTVEKSINKFKQDPIINARMIEAINNIIEN